MSKKKLPKKQLHWWPGVTGNSEIHLDEFYMSIAFLVLTYFASTVVIIVGLRYLSLIVLALYLANVWTSVYVADDLARAEKWQVFAQQTSVALILMSPLIFMFRQNWS